MDAGSLTGLMCASEKAPSPKLLSGDQILRESQGMALIGQRHQEGENLVRQGEDLIKQGRAQIAEGERMIGEGRRIISESEQGYGELKR
jgi:hypothetical protein